MSKSCIKELEHGTEQSLSTEELSLFEAEIEGALAQIRKDFDTVFKAICGRAKKLASEYETYTPKATRLTFDPFYKELYILVEWADDICEVKLCHFFHDPDTNTEPSSQEKMFRFLSDFLKLPYHLVLAWLKKALKVNSKPTKSTNVNRDFIKAMLFNSGEIVGINPSHEPKAQKILQDVGISGPFDEIFVVEKRGYRAALSADVIDLTNKPKELVHAFVCCIEDLETIGWQKMISEGPSGELF